MKSIFKKFIKLIKADFFSFLGIIFIISGLIFLLNLILVITYSAGYFGNEIQKKLGIYVYIKDNYDFQNEKNQNKERPLAKAFKLKDELESKGIKVLYRSKEDALKMMELFTPGLSQEFKKLGVGNPLMDTLYIMIKNKDQYDIAIKIINKYKDIISDIGDTWKGKNFESQKKLIQQVLEMVNFTNNVLYFLIFIVCIIITIILLFVITINFYNFYPQIEVDKLLGVSYFYIKLPFILKINFILFFGFILSMIYNRFLINKLSGFLKNIFDINIYDIVNSHLNLIGKVLSIELVSLMLLSTVASYLILQKLIKKI